MSRRGKIINSMVLCIWIALLSILLYKNYTGVPLEKAQAIKESFDEKTYWYDIYAGSKKIGFARTDIKKAGDEIIITEERKMEFIKEAAGKEEKTVLITKLKCLCNSYYSIKSLEYTSNFKGEKGLKIRGEVDDETIIFFLESPEKRKTYKTLTGGRAFYLPITLIPAIHQKNPAINTVFLIPMLNFINLSIDDVKVVLEEIRPIKVGINILSLYKFRTGNSILWSNENSIIIKEEHPSGITLYSQVETIAKDPSDRILFDYTSLPFFKSNKTIPYPEQIKTLKVKINEFPLNTKLYENSPVTLNENILTIEKLNLERTQQENYKLPYNSDNFKVYLSPDTWIASDYKPLQDTGLVYARANNYDSFLLTRYLTGYVFRLIRTMPVFIVRDSKDILKSLSGDYIERTVMFATYARAGGLPTRLVGGLVYLNGYFYFHTWPEVWLNKWIPVDPTFSQFPADVTHIPLKEGTLEEIISIVDDLKSTTIEILEAS